MTYYTGKWLTL